MLEDYNLCQYFDLNEILISVNEQKKTGIQIYFWIYALIVRDLRHIRHLIHFVLRKKNLE